MSAPSFFSMPIYAQNNDLQDFLTGITGLTGITVFGSNMFKDKDIKLPNTKKCKDYEKFARVAGAPGTHSKLIQMYNACLNSAPNSKASKKYRRKPGVYYSYFSGVRRCVKR